MGGLRALPLPDGGAPTRPRPVATPPRHGYAVVDVETTGLSPRHDRVVSVGVVLLNPSGEVEHEWGTLVDPCGPVGPTYIHGIRDEDVVGAPRFEDLVQPLIGLLQGRALAGHNVSFDANFLKYEFGRAGWGWPSVPTFCTQRESMYFLPHLDRRRLVDCCWACDIVIDGSHTALGDARATARLLATYLDPTVGVAPRDSHHAILSEAARVTWPAERGEVLPSPPEKPRRVLSDRALHVIAHRPPPKSSLLERFTLSDALDEGADAGALSYLETLAEVLEDGRITRTERTTLREVAELYDLGADDIAAAHRGFVRALAREAFDDGHLSRVEKAEIGQLATLLDVTDVMVKDLLSGAELARLQKLSASLKALPDDWPLGEPLCVGQRVAFTGCDFDQRDALEARAAAVGVSVTSNVSRRTAMLVTDGSYDGQKAEAAAAFGTRVVHPDDFEVLLEYIQPLHTPTPATRAEAASGHRTGKVVASTAPLAPCGADRVDRPAPPSVVRAWALEMGIDVGVRGRLSAEVWDAYADAHRG